MKLVIAYYTNDVVHFTLTSAYYWRSIIIRVYYKPIFPCRFWVTELVIEERIRKMWLRNSGIDYISDFLFKINHFLNYKKDGKCFVTFEIWYLLDWKKIINNLQFVCTVTPNLEYGFGHFIFKDFRIFHISETYGQ